jgi:SAM-dependent methyltransferase
MSATDAPGRRRPAIYGLACPVCGEALADRGASAACERGHSFDFARSGYLNLTRSGDPARVGDTAAMVRARAEFLDAGHFAPLAEAVAARVAAAAPAPGFAIEIGSGTGYYLDAVATRLRERTPPAPALGRAEAERTPRPAIGIDLARAPEAEAAPPAALGIDLSKAAADLAAHRHPDLAFVVADAQARIPLLDGVADASVSVFAPRPATEFARVTRPGGALVVAFAGPRHLGALRAGLGLLEVHADKLATLRERLGEWFDPAGEEVVEYPVELGRDDAEAVVLMGPNAHHGVDLAPLAERSADLVSVTVAEFRRTEHPVARLEEPAAPPEQPLAPPEGNAAPE